MTTSSTSITLTPRGEVGTDDEDESNRSWLELSPRYWYGHAGDWIEVTGAAGDRGNG